MFTVHQMDEGHPVDMMDCTGHVRPMLGRQSSWDAQGLTMSIYKNCPIWLNIWTAAAYIARLARSIKWVNQYMISCSISNFKSNADNEDHLKSLSVFFFTCTPLIRNEYLFYGNKGLKLPSDLAILSTFGRLRWLHHSLRQMRFIKVIYIWYVRSKCMQIKCIFGIIYEKYLICLNDED